MVDYRVTTESPMVSATSYDEATKVIASKVGHEFLAIPRAQREERFRTSIDYVNLHGGLGLRARDIDLIALYYTALSEIRRYAGDKVIDPDKGENTATHSLQCVALKERIFQDAARDLRSRWGGMMGNTTYDEQIAWKRYRQFAGLGVLVHDMGEVLGEFSSLHQRAHATHAIEEDPMAERKVYAYAMRLAIHAQESANPEWFFTEIDRLRSLAGLRDATGAASGIPKTADELDTLLQPDIPLSAEGEKRLDEWLALWDLAEGFDNPQHVAWAQEQQLNTEFLHTLIKSLDHVQGTRHIVRMGRRQASDQPGVESQKLDFSRIPMSKVKANLAYLEGEVGPMFDALEGEAHYPTILRHLAQHQGRKVYETASDLVDLAPPTPLAYQMLEGKGAVLDEVEAEIYRAGAGPQQRKLAQGKLCGLYDTAAEAVMQGFRPDTITDAKGKVRGRALGLDGLSEELEQKLLKGRAL